MPELIRQIELEDGISIMVEADEPVTRGGGEAGIPYITKETAESNLAIGVECSFPK